MTVNSNQLGIFAGPVVPTTPVPNAPGGNTIVPTPATPNEWWKMLIALGIGASGIWMVQQFGSENAARWLALIVLGAIITYYETHNNHQFSSMLQSTLGQIK